MTTANKQGPKTRPPEREPSVEAEIGCRLKAYYADILSRPIPDRLLHALKPARSQVRSVAAFCEDRSRPNRRRAFLAAMQPKR